MNLFQDSDGILKINILFWEIKYKDMSLCGKFNSWVHYQAAFLMAWA